MNTITAEAFRKTMELWDGFLDRARRRNPDATEEEVYQHAKAAMTWVLEETDRQKKGG